jgi:hypothetical protein
MDTTIHKDRLGPWTTPSNSKDECTHNREHRVYSISHRADEIDNPHFRTCTPSHKFSFPVPLPFVLTHVLSPQGPILLLLVSRCQLVALVLAFVLAPPAPLLLLLVSWCQLVALVLTFVLAPPAPLLLLLVVWCWLVALALAFVLAPPAPLLLVLVVWCWLVALALTFVLAPPAPLLQCVFAQCQRISPNSSIQDWHALLLNKEPWFDFSTVSSLAAAHGPDS